MTLPQHLVRWSLSAAALITVLFLNAWLERERSETEILAASQGDLQDAISEAKHQHATPVALKD